MDGRKQGLQFSDRLRLIQPALDFPAESFRRHVSLGELGNDQAAGEEVGLGEKGCLEEAQIPERERRQGPQPVGDDHGPLAEQRLERCRTRGHQHRIGGRQCGLRLARDEGHGDAGRFTRERRLEGGACTGSRERDHEREARPPRGKPGDRAREGRGESRDFAAAAARQHGDNARAHVKAERAPRRIAIRLERQLIGERVADEDRPQSRRVVDAALERQQAQDEVEETRHPRGAAAPPGPDLRAHVLHGAKSRRVQRGRDTQVEFRRVDADENVRLQRQHRGTHARAQAQEPRQVVQDLEQAHDREFLGVRKALAAGRLHARARDADKARVRRARAQGLDEPRAQVVTRGLACDEANRERTAGISDLSPHGARYVRALAGQGASRSPIVRTMGEASNEVPPRPARNPAGPDDIRPWRRCSSLVYRVIHHAPRALPGTNIVTVAPMRG